MAPHDRGRPDGTTSRLANVLDPVRDRHHANMAQIAIAWLLHRSPVMLPIPGTSSLDHFQDNLAGAAIGGTVRILLFFVITQRHTLDRRNLEAVLRPVHCD